MLVFLRCFVIIQKNYLLVTTMLNSKLFLFPALASLLLITNACTNTQQTSVKNAVTAPLHDLNMLKTNIPPVLIEAAKAPYLQPDTYRCMELNEKIAALSEVLPADIDQPKKEETSLLQKGAKEAEDVVIGTLHKTTTSVIPYRNWVRKLTGAERHSKTVKNALLAGSVRRAYLKGIRTAYNCSANN